jgi:glycine/D-amino acid oxidase-like deaminating enzyme
LSIDYDAVVVGGGFYGCIVSLELTRHFPRVALLEKESDLLQRASYVNQARIHQGYHYPRSILTALRSRVNFSRFVEEFAECVYSEFDAYYAIGKLSSKVSSQQFRLFCNRIGAPIQPAPASVKRFFNNQLIEEVYTVKEYAFDAVKLKHLVLERIRQSDISMLLDTQVTKVSRDRDKLHLDFEQEGAPQRLGSNYVFNCTYSQINQLLDASHLPLIPLRHEYTEMALFEVPDELQHIGITVMDGPFFSLMPFPPRDLHSLSHVRYTPHHHWQDHHGQRYLNAHKYFEANSPQSHYSHMIKDAQRYVPLLERCRYADSLWEVKTVLPQSEIDDSRPILFRQSDELPGLFSIVGGKIDNIFDILENLQTRFKLEKAEP